MNRNDELLADWRDRALTLEHEVSRAVIGQTRVIRLVNTAVFARGHVLLQGDVGVGKTTLLRAFARVLGGAYARTEGTIDLMPNDLVYYTYISAEGRPAVERGPLIEHGEDLAIFFFNEINRARPQVQSLLLRAMAERSVFAFDREYRFPYMTVFADRNKVEKEETFELAAAARDRFMFELNMSTPDDAAARRALVFDPDFHDTEALLARVTTDVLPWQRLNAIGASIQRTIHASEAIERYALDIWRATENPLQFDITLDDVDMQRLILAGASPRGMSALLRAARVVAWLDGRTYLMPEDIHRVLLPTLGHRVYFTPIYELRRQELSDALMTQIVSRIAAP